MSLMSATARAQEHAHLVCLEQRTRSGRRGHTGELRVNSAALAVLPALLVGANRVIWVVGSASTLLSPSGMMAAKEESCASPASALLREVYAGAWGVICAWIQPADA